MLTYRTFRNIDPPAVAAVWERCADRFGLYRPVSANLLEELVFSKLYFDPAGLFLAFDGSEPVGLAHAGFSPDASNEQLDWKQGVVCVLLVAEEFEHANVADRLLQLSEDYLRKHGADTVQVGGIRPLDPFYLGLCCGSEVPGIPAAAEWLVQTLRARGYQQQERTCRFRLSVADFAPPVDYRQIQLRRQLRVDCREQPPARNWWEACALDLFDTARFRVTRREGGPTIATTGCWRMNLTYGRAAVRAAGLTNVHVAKQYRRQGIATYLVFETARYLRRQGIATLEMLARDLLPGSDAFCRRLGMEPIARGLVFAKQLGPG